jgi:hypothetical protein
MFVSADGDNALYELARAMTAGGRHSMAIVLRKLAYEGYTSLEQVDTVSDWALLSIRGIGVGRLGEVRRLTRPDWQPPSPQAIQAGNWFLSAAQFALRYWPPETLASLVRGSAPTIANRGPAEKRLALDVFSLAVRKALRYCKADELVRSLGQAGAFQDESICEMHEPSPVSSVELETATNRRTEASALVLSQTVPDENDGIRESDHFAYPRHERIKIVRHYWTAREKGKVKNKDNWARSNYHVSGKTLLSYEREFPETEQDVATA